MSQKSTDSNSSKSKDSKTSGSKDSAATPAETHKAKHVHQSVRLLNIVLALGMFVFSILSFLDIFTNWS